MPFISICIPAYKRVNFLKRLLDSISIQSFKDFEVIISDDSDDDSVKKLISNYETKFLIRYFKNEKALGTPANWNFGIAQAVGEWIKLIHDDDWFAVPEALGLFVQAAKTEGKHFIFSAYTNCFRYKEDKIFASKIWRKRIINCPDTLLAKNIVGPPSVTLIHKSIKEQYDEQLKWRVDMEFYIRLLDNGNGFTYINNPLINVGISDSQVTNYCIYKPEVELPEGFILLQKHGTDVLKNIWVYDAWWRLLRNMKIYKESQLLAFINKTWPVEIFKIISDLNMTPKFFLKFGATSKFFMGLSYLVYILKNKKWE